MKETKKQMYGTVFCFAVLRFARAACESLDMQQAVVFSIKGVCALYLILFFLYMRYWGLKLLDRLESMNKRTTLAGGKETKSSIKKNAALRRFQIFLAWESIVATLWLAELTASSVLKSYEIVTLKTTQGALVVFTLKVVQRGTEWVMMFLLSYLVCLKTASKNFTMNYRLPTITVPVICSGSGWCTNVGHNVDEDVFEQLIERDEVAPLTTRTFIRRALGLSMTSFGSSFGYSTSDAAARSSQSTVARSSQGTTGARASSLAGSIKSVRERRNSKREAVNEANRRLVEMPKIQDKRKREFGKVSGRRSGSNGAALRRPSATGGIELQNRAAGEIGGSSNAGRIQDVYDDGGERSSEFVGENPMAQQRSGLGVGAGSGLGAGGRGGRGGKAQTKLSIHEGKGGIVGKTTKL